MGIEDSLEKILKKLDALETKIDDLAVAVKTNAQSAIEDGSSASISPSSPIIGRSPSEVAAAQKEGGTSTIEGRLKCPECGSINVQTMDDKERPISASGGIMIYGKRYYCKSCSKEWK